MILLYLTLVMHIHYCSSFYITLLEELNMKDPIILIDENFPVIKMKYIARKIMSQQQTIRVYKIKEDKLERVCYARIIKWELCGSCAGAVREL